MSIFGPPRLNLVLQHYAKLWRHIQKRYFWEFYLTYIKTNGTIGFLSSFRIINMQRYSKFENFKIWPFLTWGWTWFRFLLCYFSHQYPEVNEYRTGEHDATRPQETKNSPFTDDQIWIIGLGIDIAFYPNLTSHRLGGSDPTPSSVFQE